MSKAAIILIVAAAAMAFSARCGAEVAPAKPAVVDRPNTKLTNDFYVSNREPLLPSPFMKLPIGAIKPRGWVRKQLELQAGGFVGHLTEISRFLRKEGHAWLSPEGKGHDPWEEMPYWLKGFGDTGYLLGDERIIKEARVWIEGAIASRRKDGYFGPRANLTRSRGKPDLWPNMIMLFALQSYYEYSGDKRVLELMSGYFRWETTIGEKDLLVPYWQQQRAADNLFSIYWLYNRTGEKFLLELAPRIHRNTANWTDEIPNWHNVNMSQAFGGPGTYYVQSKVPGHLAAAERNYRKMRDMYGQVPGGMFGGDENCRRGFTGPRQAVETCGMVEMMLSHETLLRITGDPLWADRCEDVAFNSLPAALTADLKALRYLTAPNLVLSDRHNKSPGFQNRGAMLLMNPHAHRCCQHNMGHGWPYYAENLWLATPGNGLAAVLYAASEVTAKVGQGTKVTITEKTGYPFDERVEFRLSSPRPVRFPLYLRVPGWCDRASVKINGRAVDVKARPRSYIVIDRQWADGDKVSLELAMKIALTTWKKNHNCVSVNRGPLTYSLKIGEKYVRQGGTDKWPAWEIHPTTAWNYGLVLDEKDAAGSFKVVRRSWPPSDRPFAGEDVPIELRAKGRKIPSWKLDHLGLVGKMRPSPVKSGEPVETITLIPMGAARLRISAFPTIGEGPGAHEWPEPKTPTPAAASHCHGSDTLTALSDGMLPGNSADHGVPRFTWWPRKGTTEWVRYDFTKARKVSAVEVYWFDDTGRGYCRVPESWTVLYRAGKEWKPVTGAGPCGVKKDRFNKVKFKTVETDALRLEVRLQPEFSGGILEWRVES